MADSMPVSRRGFLAGASALAAGVALSDAATSQPATKRAAHPTPVSKAWPVLTRYDGDHLSRIMLPLGGIGTGTISLGGRGNLLDFELANRPAKGYTPPNTFFALWCKPRNGDAVTRCLEGPYYDDAFYGADGAIGRMHGLPRFRQCEFAAAYPLGQVMLADKDVPLRVRLEAFNPMVPVDGDVSGIPCAILRYVLINPTDSPIEASVCGSMENFIGWTGNAGGVNRNINELRDGDGLRGVFMRSDGIASDAAASGTMSISTTQTNNVTRRFNWADLNWGDTLLDFWDDFAADGKVEPRKSAIPGPFASVAASVEVPARGEASVTFLITWHYPNRVAWNPPAERVGNFYTLQYKDAWDAAVRTAPRLAELEAKTVDFVRSFVDADLPAVIKEAALYNTSTLRTQTVFRTEDGKFFGWEGCNNHDGWCHGNCTHVWNYEQATPFLYGAFARSMRETEFAFATGDDGLMSFRANLPLRRAKEERPAAADGQMGSVMKLYRDWRMSGDTEMLERLWPMAKKALAFAWIKGGWDADKDGVMEGCQHNTMDIEYYGPNPEVGTWYLGALVAASKMARAVGDDGFGGECERLAERGGKWIDANLFNGEYYEHEIRPVADERTIAPGLRLGAGAKNTADPDNQLGAGCLTDQLVGQYFAHVAGLGYLLDARHVKTSLASILKYNYREDLTAHFNHLRTYALGGEAGTIIATYPKGRRPRRPFPYVSEVWSGLEYTAAVGMLYEGLVDEALQIVTAVRARHEGARRNPFNEPECGHHYARAMASWGLILAATGFHYDGVDKHLTFASAKKPTTWFWSSGDAWGVVEQSPKSGGSDVTVTVKGGTIAVASLELRGLGTNKLPDARTLNAGDVLKLNVTSA